jgi:hypothetical protein
VILKALTDGGVTSTDTLTCASGLFGVLISTDATNAATVTVQRVGSGGKTVFDYVGVGGHFVVGPISLEDSTALYYSVSGTGATAMFYEWIN